MRNYLILLFIAFSFSCQKNTSSQKKETTAPRTIDSTYLKNKLAYFTIDNNTISGSGKEMLEQLVNESQFLVFGEYHYSKETSLLTRALVPLLSKANYKHFVAEVGPHSGQKLMELSSPHTATVENLKTFITKYKHKELGETADPIPFFAGVEDAEFLAAFRKHHMEIHGIDQEYFYAILFFMDELLQKAKEKSNYEAIVKLKKEVDAIIFKHLKDDNEDKIESALALIIKDEKLNEFFSQFDKNDTKAKAIIHDLKLSWDIYIRWRKGSHADRISYMRNNLTKIYKKDPKAKMFIKMGSLHVSKILSNDAYDIGDLTEKLAQKEGTVSTSINSWRPLYKENNKVINYLEKYKNYYKKYDVFFKFLKENEWTIIDLKSIREDIRDGKIALPTDGSYHGVRALIEGYDYQLILPIDSSITYNLKH